MPYIDSAARKRLDPLIDALYHMMDIENSDGLKWAGNLNYVVTCLAMRSIPRKKYWMLALAVGTLFCCILELYRRVVGPYEDEAIAKNGDLPDYKI